MIYKFGTTVHLPNNAHQEYEKELLQLVDQINFLIDSSANTTSFEKFDKKIKNIEVEVAVILAAFLKKIIRSATRVDKINSKLVANSLKNIELSASFAKNIAVKEELKIWISQNARLIKTIPEQMLGKFEEIFYEHVRAGLTHDDLKKKLFDSFAISKKRASVIAKDQVNKFNGVLTRVKNLEIGITDYKWVTSRDERVRHSHEVLEGKICSWENPRVYRRIEKSTKWLQRSSISATLTHPSQDVLCRCTSIPVIKN